MGRDVPHHDKMSFGGIKLDFMPTLKPNQWYITKINNITLYTDRDWSDPKAVFTVRATITVTKTKNVRGWYQPWHEEYQEAWIDLDSKGEVLNYDDTKDGKTFNKHEHIPAKNIKDVIQRIKDQMNKDPEELKNLPEDGDEEEA